MICDQFRDIKDQMTALRLPVPTFFLKTSTRRSNLKRRKRRNDFRLKPTNWRRTEGMSDIKDRIQQTTLQDLYQSVTGQGLTE